jgi:hypothetical protein
LIGEIASGKTLPQEVLRQIVAKADGVPLFAEELTKTVPESGLLREDTDAWRLDGPLPPLAIPSSLHDSFIARLDRMSPIKEIAQMGAAIGRDFSARLLGAVLGMNAATLNAALTQLIAAGLLVRRGIDDTYAFNHALTRDAAYASLLKSRRQICPSALPLHWGSLTMVSSERRSQNCSLIISRRPGISLWPSPIGSRRATPRSAAAATRKPFAHFRSAKRSTESADLSAADRARTPEVLMKLANAQMQTAGYHSEQVFHLYEEAHDAALTLDQQNAAAVAEIQTSTFLFGNCPAGPNEAAKHFGLTTIRARSSGHYGGRVRRTSV